MLTKSGPVWHRVTTNWQKVATNPHFRRTVVVTKKPFSRLRFLILKLRSKIYHGLVGFRPADDEGRRDYFVPIRGLEHKSTWSEVESEENIKSITSFIVERDKELAGNIEKAEYSADAFLLTANAGATIAILGLLQRVEALRKNYCIKIAICCFAVSIVALTTLKIVRIVRYYYIRGEWKKNSRAYFFGGMSLDDLLRRDSVAWREPKAIILSAWVSYLFFLIGILLAITAIGITS